MSETQKVPNVDNGVDQERLSNAERRERELCVLMAWESKSISIHDACRALNVTREDLFDLELAAVVQGVQILRDKAAS